MTVAIRFEHVSKRFRVYRDRPRTFLEMFTGLARRRSRPREFFWALDDISFEIPTGQMVGLIGPNGSGKSTALKLMAHILEPTSGTVQVSGRVAALLELGTGFHPDLTGRENVYLNGALLGFTRADMRRRLDEIVAFSDLEPFIDTPVKHYSSGMYVRLAFAVAVHLNPEVLLVDEVLAVGDAVFQHKCLNHIAALRRSGVTIILVSHDLGTVQSLCEQAIWFDRGRLRAHGQANDVVRAYLSDVAEREEAIPAAQGELALAHSRRRGTGKVQITRVELCDENGIPRTAFPTGGPLQVRLRYRADTRVSDPIFGIAIHHQNGVHICGPNTGQTGPHIPAVEGEGEIVYHVPSLPLLQGGYVLSVAVHNRAESEMYDYHDQAYPFHVHPGQCLERYGLMTLNGTWELEAAQSRTTTTSGQSPYASSS